MCCPAAALWPLPIPTSMTHGWLNHRDGVEVDLREIGEQLDSPCEDHVPEQCATDADDVAVVEAAALDGRAVDPCAAATRFVDDFDGSVGSGEHEGVATGDGVVAEADVGAVAASEADQVAAQGIDATCTVDVVDERAGGTCVDLGWLHGRGSSERRHAITSRTRGCRRRRGWSGR